MAMDADVRENPAEERQKLLAARGWEADRERTGVLRELLGRSVERVYLWSFSRLRSRDKALELTRNTLLWASRSLCSVPEGRLLDHWIFEHLATETSVRLDLLRSELGPEPCQVLGDEPNLHYLEAYPECRALQDAYASYRALPTDAQLVQRSGWATVQADLERFLEGHFGEEHAQQSERKDPLGHRLGRVGLRQLLPVLLILGLAGYAWWLRAQNIELRAALAEKTPAGEIESAEARPDPAETSLGQVRNLGLEVSDEFLTFSWDGSSRAEFYRLVLMNAKMDTMTVKSNIVTSRTMVRRDEASFVRSRSVVRLKVDAVRSNRVIATSGMTTYPPL
ncbi:MAG: hypothetical protein R3E97_14085 [Candidatus Eisenbacteria bacterium]